VVTMKSDVTVLRLNIKKSSSGTSYIPSLSVRDLRALDELHKRCHYPRKWRLALDGSALILE